VGDGEPMSELLPEWAFYYPNPVWSQSNWLKNLVLFFDGIMMLAPEFARDSPFEDDSETAPPRLREAGLLKSFVDPAGARVMADALIELIAGGSLDPLVTRPTEFRALSYSQLGYMTDGRLAEIIYQGGCTRGASARRGPREPGRGTQPSDRSSWCCWRRSCVPPDANRARICVPPRIIMSCTRR
jgi:hypothetical protein